MSYWQNINTGDVINSSERIDYNWSEITEDYYDEVQEIKAIVNRKNLNWDKAKQKLMFSLLQQLLLRKQIRG